jgi:hypothetical protein
MTSFLQALGGPLGPPVWLGRFCCQAGVSSLLAELASVGSAFFLEE